MQVSTQTSTTTKVITRMLPGFAALVLLIVMLFGSRESYGQISVTTNGTAVTQNFDAMLGTSATAALTTNAWRIANNAVAGNWSTANITACTQRSGSDVTASSGGYYNAASGGTAAAGTERSLGFLSSGTAPFTASSTTPLHILAQYNNATGGTVNTLTGSFDYEKFRKGTNAAGFSFNFYYSTDGTNWTNVTSGNNAYTADADNLIVNPSTTISKTFSITGLSIANGANFYLRWSYSVTTGTTATNAQGLAIDNVSLTTGTSATPTISATGTLSAVNTTYGTASATPTSFSVSGANMTAGILVTPPSGFEVSQTSGGASGYAATQTVGSSGTIASTTVYVRLKNNAAVSGSPYSGNVVLTSSGASTVNVATASSTVSPAALTVTASNQSKSYNTTLSLGTSAFTSSGLVLSETIGSVTLTDGGQAANATANVGTYSITPSAATGGSFTAGNYTITYVDGTLTINKANQTITFGALASKADTDAPFALTGSASSGLTVSYSSSNTAVATVSGNTLTPVAAGSSTISASQAGDANWNAATPVSQTQVITSTTASDQTITFEALDPVTYGGGTFNLGATTTSNLTITYTSSNTSVATVSGATVTILHAGTTTITASQPGNASYNAAVPVQQLLTVNPKTLSSTAVADNKQYDGTTTATLSSIVLIGIVGTDVVSTTGGGSFDDANVANGIGVTASLTLTGADATNYILEQPGDLTANITPATNTITFVQPVTKTYGDASFTLNGTATSGGTVSFSSGNTAVATISGNTVTIVGAGTAVITATQAGGGNYAAATPVDRTLTVNKANQTISFTAITAKTTGSAPFGLTATASSGLAVTFTSNSTSIVTVSGSTATMAGATGTGSITASQAGDANYNAATPVTNTFAVTAAVLAAWPTTWTGTPTTSSATTLGSNVSSAVMARVGLTAGSSGSRFSSSNWSASNYLTLTLTPTAGNGINLNGMGLTMAFGSSGTGPNLYTVYSSVDNYSTALGTFTPSCTAQAAATTITLPSSGYNNLCSVIFRVYGSTTGCSSTFATTGTGGPSTISFAGTASTEPVPSITSSLTASGSYGAAFTYNITASNTPSSYTATGLPTGLSVNTTTGAITGSPTQGGSFNVSISATNCGGTSSVQTLVLTIAQGSQTITFNTPATKTYGDASFTLNGTASSGLTVSYSSSNTSVATISGNTVTIVGAGTSTITASQAGNADYAAATPVDRTLTVNKANQTITFTTLADKNDTDAPFVLTASASSGLTVSYSSGNTSVATVSGNTLTIIAPGDAVITASQAGDANYNAATSVNQNQHVINTSLANQTISWAPLAAATYGDAPFNLTATASSSLTVTYTSSNTAVATVSGNTVTILTPGVTTITAHQAGNGSYNPAPDSAQVLTVNTKNLTVSGAAAQNKVYDGNTTAVITGATLNGVVGSDDVTVSGGGTFASANGGTAIAVTPSLMLGGAQASYYTLTQPTGLSADITPASQTITFNTLVNRTDLDPNFNLTATASSFLAVSYSSSNTAVATIIGDTAIHIVGAGTTTITATQAGNSNYAAATLVARTLTVAASVARWTFDGVSVSASASASPSITSGSAVADAGAQTSGSAFSSLHASSATLWTTPAGNASAKSVTSDHWAIGDYWQFQVNTTGYYNIGLSFDQTGSNTGPANFTVKYSTDGTNYTDFTTYTVTNDSWSSAVGATRKTASIKLFDLSAITAINGASTVYFRLVDNSTTAISGSLGTGGSSRVDNFTVLGTPCAAPASFNVTGGGAYCAGGSGSAVGLDGSATGVNYQLVRDGSTNVGSPVAGTGSPISFGNQTTAGTYTVVATTTASSCTGSMTGNAVVSITTVSAPTTDNATQTFCNAGTVAGLSATGTAIKWYDAASNGTLYTGTDALVNGNHYYASQTVGTCESQTRLDVTVVINVTGVPTGDATQTLCADTKVSDLVASGTGIQWYADATGGTALSFSTPLVDGSHYYASQTISGCESATRLDVTVTILNAPSVAAITGASQVVIGDDTQFSSTTSGGTWTSDNTAVATVDAAGLVHAVAVGTTTINYAVANACGTTTVHKSIQVIPACYFTVADSIVGALNACPFASPGTANNGTYSIATTSASDYVWSVSSPSTMTIVSGQNTNSIQVHYSATFVSGTISVTVSSACGADITRTTNTITKKAPAVPGTISGPINVCTTFGTPITYTIAPVAGAITYRWTLPANVTLQSATSDSTSITVVISSTFMSNASTAKSIKVKSISGCGNSADKTLALLTAAPVMPGVISGPVNVCPYVNAATVATYTIRKVANASSYIWTVPTGATITSHPGGDGTANDTIITVSYDNSVVAASTIQVQSSSTCGTSLAKTLALKRTAPATPGAITGPLNVCPLMEGSIETNGIDTVYKIRKVIDVTSYNWVVPSGASIVAHPGGEGTANDTIIRVHFTSTFTSGNVTVSSTNGCGTSLNKILAIKRLLPATPGTITGTINPCPTIGGPDTTTYRIKKALNALSYNWVAPTGGTIVSHPGGEGTINDTIVIIRWTSAFTTGNVSVTSQNNCFTSLPKTLAIVRKLPAVPGTITGLTNPCPTMGSPVTYSIAALPLNATHVLWTAPSGASIVGADDQLSVQIVYTTGFTTGSVSVVGVNQCTSSLPKTLSIVRVLPAAPGTITASKTAAAAQADCPNRVINYSVTALPLNAVSLVWNVPSGATYEVLSATSIAVTYPSTAVSGAVTVAGKNGCDQVGAAKSLTITLAACPVGGEAPKYVATPYTQPVTQVLESVVFPNPSTSGFKLNVTSASKDRITVRIMDAMGRPYKMMNMNAGETITFGNDLKTGTYMVEIIQGSKRTTQQIIKL